MWGRPKDLRIFWKWCPCTRCDRKRVRVAEAKVFEDLYTRAFRFIRASGRNRPGAFVVTSEEWRLMAFRAISMSHSTAIELEKGVAQMTFLGLRLVKEEARRTFETYADIDRQLAAVGATA